MPPPPPASLNTSGPYPANYAFTYPLNNPYVITINPNFIANGNNVLTFSVVKTNNVPNNPAIKQFLGSGFSCDAELQITYGAPKPKVYLTGSSHDPCSTGVLKVKVTEPGIHNVSIYALESQGGVGVSYLYHTTQITSSSPLDTPIVLPYPTIFQIDVTNSCNGTTTVFAPMKLCGHQRVAITPGEIIANKFTISAIPEDDDEASIPGFEYAWFLEEINPATGKANYMIENPSCWQTGASANTFNGFNGAADYASSSFSCPANAFDGVFYADKTYRITRAYRHNGINWEKQTVMIGWDYADEPLGKRSDKPTVKPVKSPDLGKQLQGSDQELTLYPNPGNGVFMISPAKQGNGVIEVFDIRGQKVKSIAITTEHTTYPLDLTGYAKGVYLVNVQQGEELQQKKVVLE